MVTQYIHSALTETDYLTTDLNSLANDGAFLGAAINNSTNRDMLLKVQIQLASVDLSAQANPAVLVRLIESIDGGTVYEDNDSTAYAITLPVAATSAAHVRIGELMIPPGYFKLAVVNKTGAAFAAANNVLSYAPYTPETDS
ncbi:MAG: hypothetical protein RBT11_14265 [Desulfobacterales bacterium]|jgi:hypothetical protein|nr:hypothetical protein [Desulfobacterales bacterium]